MIVPFVELSGGKLTVVKQEYYAAVPIPRCSTCVEKCIGQDPPKKCYDGGK